MKPRLPAEWEPQTGVMLTWPHPDSDWQAVLKSVESVFVDLTKAISQRQNVLLVCYDAAHRQSVQDMLEHDGIDTGVIRFALCASNDSWARDHGPVSIFSDGRVELLNFRFNGWGEKYPAERDDAINHCLAAQGVFGDTEWHDIDLVLEGGSIDSDGEGTLLTSTSCLLHRQRNPTLTRRQITQQLSARLGAERIIWLENTALAGDDTDGHVDMLARFTDPHTLVYQHCDEPDYAEFATLTALQHELEQLRQANGDAYRLVALPWPSPKLNARGERLPASYANFLIINDAVLVPVYEDRADDQACEILQSLFPRREIVPVNCRPLIEQSGSLHCVTMQLYMPW